MSLVKLQIIRYSNNHTKKVTRMYVCACCGFRFLYLIIYFKELFKGMFGSPN
jgi:hypothetical protein